MASVAKDMPRTKHPLAPLEVYINLWLKKKTLCKFLSYPFRWEEQQKGSHDWNSRAVERVSGRK